MTAPPFTERPPATPRRSWSDWLPSTPALPTDPITPSDPGGPTRANRVIMHIDMDAFYASVELRRRPDLVGKPMFVGGAERGVVLSANYEARAFGIEGGMPSSRARRLCPQAVAVPPDFDTYGEVSAGIVAAFDSVTAHVESASIDEAYLDVTGSQRVFGSPRAIGEYLRALVADKAAVIRGWIADGRLGPVDPEHLFFSLWALTQTYADFETQVGAVLGRSDLTSADYRRATDHVLNLVLRGCGLMPPAAIEEPPCST